MVQAKSPTIANLGKAAQTAAGLPGVVAVSNSYGGGDLSDASYGAYYNHPGVAVTASSGDERLPGRQLPGLLELRDRRRWYVAVRLGHLPRLERVGVERRGERLLRDQRCPLGRLVVRHRVQPTRDGRRLRAADPANGGLAVYYPTSNTSGYANPLPYAHSGSLFDVTSGSNGSCSPSQLCAARGGWDGPTGLGTPNGTGAF